MLIQITTSTGQVTKYLRNLVAKRNGASLLIKVIKFLSKTLMQFLFSTVALIPRIFLS
ncbi:hypothetical protein Avbf_13506 [Armadillidium vulgare]|nr:hypothetical protein Avbf_13506 [Armadillidium vulgare]